MSDAVQNSPLGKLICFMQKELILRGILFTLLGILICCNPAKFMTVITVIIGCLILGEGIFLLAAAIRYQGVGRGLYLTEAILFILFGLASVSTPFLVEMIWVVMIGFWQLLNGLQCLCFRNSARGMSLFNCIFSLLCGMALISSPFTGLIAISWLLGLILLCDGISGIVLGIRIRQAVK